jgi:hypothetical protein
MASKFVDVRFSQALRASLPIYVIFFVTIATRDLPARPAPMAAEGCLSAIGRVFQSAGRGGVDLSVREPWCGRRDSNPHDLKVEGF